MFESIFFKKLNYSFLGQILVSVFLVSFLIILSMSKIVRDYYLARKILNKKNMEESYKNIFNFLECLIFVCLAVIFVVAIGYKKTRYQGRDISDLVDREVMVKAVYKSLNNFKKSYNNFSLECFLGRNCCDKYWWSQGYVIIKGGDMTWPLLHLDRLNSGGYSELQAAILNFYNKIKAGQIKAKSSYSFESCAVIDVELHLERLLEIFHETDFTTDFDILLKNEDQDIYLLKSKLSKCSNLIQFVNVLDELDMLMKNVQLYFDMLLAFAFKNHVKVIEKNGPVDAEEN